MNTSYRILFYGLVCMYIYTIICIKPSIRSPTPVLGGNKGREDDMRYRKCLKRTGIVVSQVRWSL